MNACRHLVIYFNIMITEVNIYRVITVLFQMQLGCQQILELLFVSNVLESTVTLVFISRVFSRSR
jgi:hypothetical protein